jgi:hypothetical protein
MGADTVINNVMVGVKNFLAVARNFIVGVIGSPIFMILIAIVSVVSAYYIVKISVVHPLSGHYIIQTLIISILVFLVLMYL